MLPAFTTAFASYIVSLLLDALVSLGGTLGRLGEHKRARELLEQALALVRRLGTSIGRLLLSAGRVALLRGDLDAALHLVNECIRSHEQAGNLFGAAMARLREGRVLRLKKEYARSRRSFLAALHSFHDTGMQTWAGRCLPEIAATLAMEERYEHAARLLGAAESVLEVLPRFPGDEDAAHAVATLKEPAYEAFREEGQAMSLDEAVRYATEAEGS